jgi:hypothetical protein
MKRMELWNKIYKTRLWPLSSFKHFSPYDEGTKKGMYFTIRLYMCVLTRPVCDPCRPSNTSVRMTRVPRKTCISQLGHIFVYIILYEMFVRHYQMCHVCLSVRMEQRLSHWMDLSIVLYCVCLPNMHNNTTVVKALQK